MKKYGKKHAQRLDAPACDIDNSEEEEQENEEEKLFLDDWGDWIQDDMTIILTCAPMISHCLVSCLIQQHIHFN